MEYLLLLFWKYYISPQKGKIRVNRKRKKIYEQLSILGSKLSGLKISDLNQSEGDTPRSIKNDLINFDYSKQRVNH